MNLNHSFVVSVLDLTILLIIDVQRYFAALIFISLMKHDVEHLFHLLY